MQTELTRHGAAGDGLARDEAIREITRRLVAICRPIRVYLFGSVARGDDGPDSDLDFLLVLPDDAQDDLFRTGKLVRALWGISYGADVIPWRQTDFEGRAAFVVTSLPATVMREGRLLYDAGRVVARRDTGMDYARNEGSARRRDLRERVARRGAFSLPASRREVSQGVSYMAPNRIP